MYQGRCLWLLLACFLASCDLPQALDTRASVTQSDVIDAVGFAPGFTNKEFVQSTSLAIARLDQEHQRPVTGRHWSWLMQPLGAEKPGARVFACMFTPGEAPRGSFFVSYAVGTSPPAVARRQIEDLARSIDQDRSVGDC